MHRKLFLILLLQFLSHASCDEVSDYYDALFPVESPRKGVPFAQQVAMANYQCDTHHVTTSDGYILTLYHIHPNENAAVIHSTPILFMHGLYLSSDDCIIPGPGKANCYICADNGYHIWAGNSRGNKYSRNHTTLDPDADKEFWDFTFDDMALYDMPAIIDYILAQSGQPQLYYIGHSQGVTNLLLLGAQKPEFNDKVKYAIGMSSATWMDHTRLLPLGLQAALAVFFHKPLGEIFAYGGPVQKFAELLCGTTTLSYPMCSVFIFALFGYNEFTISPETVSVAISLNPAATSYKNFVRWGQIVNNGFSRFDYGALKNLQVYGSLKPPIYDLSKYRVPTHFITSDNDYVCDPKDLNTLMAHLTGCSQCTTCKLSREYFCHIDYIYSDLIDVAIAPIYLKIFENGEVTCT